MKTLTPQHLAIAGIHTDAGKTIASAILVKALQADYWKPVQCGHLHASDTMRVKALVDDPKLRCHPEAYRFTQPLSPHAAAAHAGETITLDRLTLPKTNRALVIETAGGVLTPYTDEWNQIDAFTPWDCDWILVSKHYLGSINHTLLTIEAMQKRHCRLLGIIFNGEENPATENVILNAAKCPLIGRFIIPNHPTYAPLDAEIINAYAQLWNTQIKNILTTR